jgi:hypothetical protein
MNERLKLGAAEGALYVALWVLAAARPSAGLDQLRPFSVIDVSGGSY